MGSIGERAGTAGCLYCASEAALHSVLKDASLVLGHRAAWVAFPPGGVRTDLGGAQAHLSARRSVSDMRRRFTGLTPSQTGNFLDHDGNLIAW